MNLLLAWAFSILLYKYLQIKVVDFRQKPTCMQLCKKQRMVFSTSNVFDSSIKYPPTLFIPTACYHYVTYEFQSESTLCSLPECQGTPCMKQALYLKFK